MTTLTTPQNTQRSVGASVWWNGQFVATADAKVSVFTHTLHYGLGAFEGIRCYKTQDGRLAVFRLEEHIKRLFESCKILNITIPYTEQQICDAVLETIKKSGISDNIYIRPLVFIGDGPLGVFPTFTPPVETMIMTWQWGAYLGKQAKEQGARVKIASFSRGWVNSTMTKSKMIGGYTTGILAKMEVKRAGYDEALLLDVDGYVAEGSGENIFFYRKGVLKTTPLTSILEGITRETIMQLARDQGLKVEEARFTRDELYCADEVFFTGTAAEITPIREIDDRPIGTGQPGPISKRLSALYQDLVTGGSVNQSRYDHWLTYV